MRLCTVYPLYILYSTSSSLLYTQLLPPHAHVVAHKHKAITPGVNVVADVVKKSASAALWAHVIAMSGAWCWFILWGVTLSSRARNVKGKPKGAWFASHRALNSVGWLVQLGGFAAAVYYCQTSL